MSNHSVPRIEYLRVQNYRALRDLELKNITPLTALVGPNESGKSTVLDVFAFLSDSFQFGLRRAWEERGRFRQLRTLGVDEPIVIELKYREAFESPLITYHLAIGETTKGPYIIEEWLQWPQEHKNEPFRLLEFQEGSGIIIAGENPDTHTPRITEQLNAPDVLAVNTLGQFKKYPRVSALRTFITDWNFFHLTAKDTRSISESSPREQLSATGDNLAKVLQYLKEQHPENLEKILHALAVKIPGLERVEIETAPDGNLLLQIKDTAFNRPISAKFASSGVLQMLQYLTILHDPEPPRLIGIEEPENYLHPRLQSDLAGEFREASADSQLLVTTHSSFFIDSLRPEEVWILYRDENGYTKARCAAEMRGIKSFIEHGAALGQLWTENYFEVGDPLINAGGITQQVV